MAPAEIGPFPRGMKAISVDVMRNCCVTLLPPLNCSVLDMTARTGRSGIRGEEGLGGGGGLGGCYSSSDGFLLSCPDAYEDIGSADDEAYVPPSSSRSYASSLISSSSFSRNFASRQFQKIKHSMSTSSMKGGDTKRSGLTSKQGTGGSLAGAGSDGRSSSRGGGGKDRGRVGEWAGYTDVGKGADSHEETHEDTAAANAAFHAQACPIITHTSPSRSSSLLSTTAASSGREGGAGGGGGGIVKTLHGLRRQPSHAGNAGSHTSGGSHISGSSSIPNKLSSIASESTPTRPLPSPQLSGALGKRTTVGQAALGGPGGGGGGDASGIPPRQREKSLIMAGTPSGMLRMCSFSRALCYVRDVEVELRGASRVAGKESCLLSKSVDNKKTGRVHVREAPLLRMLTVR